MFQCPNCKNEQQTGKFCRTCGTPLEKVTAETELRTNKVQQERNEDEKKKVENERQRESEETKQDENAKVEKEQRAVDAINVSEETPNTSAPPTATPPVRENAAPSASNSRQGQGGKFKKYINFDVMITPTIIKIIFWIGVAASAIFGIITSVSGLGMIVSGFGDGIMGLLTFISGLVIIAVGSILSRIYCELMIVFFKMQETLYSIDQKINK